MNAALRRDRTAGNGNIRVFGCNRRLTGSDVFRPGGISIRIKAARGGIYPECAVSDPGSPISAGGIDRAAGDFHLGDSLPAPP